MGMPLPQATRIPVGVLGIPVPPESWDDMLQRVGELTTLIQTHSAHPTVPEPGSIKDWMVDTISASHITTGTLQASTLTINSDGVIQSSDYSAGSAGFKITPGAVEFNDGTFRGTLSAVTGSFGAVTVSGTMTVGAGGSIVSATGGFSLTSGGVLTATSGTFTGTVNASGGSVTGNLSVSGWLTSSGSGGYRSASSGARVEIASGTGVKWYSSSGLALTIAHDGSKVLMDGVTAVTFQTTGSLDVKSTGSTTTLGGSSGTTSISGTAINLLSVASIVTGSAGAPGLYFSGDSNTGIYQSAADKISISTGGTERMRINASGEAFFYNLRNTGAPSGNEKPVYYDSGTGELVYDGT